MKIPIPIRPAAREPYFIHQPHTHDMTVRDVILLFFVWIFGWAIIAGIAWGAYFLYSLFAG